MMQICEKDMRGATTADMCVGVGDEMRRKDRRDRKKRAN